MAPPDCAMAKLLLPARLWDRVVAQARAEAPQECCGLLAGTRQGAVLLAKEAFPLVNQLGSPTRFVSEPGSLFRALKQARAQGLEVVAIYHSHPDSPPVPSRTDLEWRWAPGVADLIVGLSDAEAQGRAWNLHAPVALELALEIVTG